MMSQTIFEDEAQVSSLGVTAGPGSQETQGPGPQETQEETQVPGSGPQETQVCGLGVNAGPDGLGVNARAEARTRIIELWRLLESYAQEAATWSSLPGCSHLRQTIDTFCVKVTIVTSQLDGVDVYKLPDPGKVLGQLEQQADKIRRDWRALKPTDVWGINMLADKEEPEDHVKKEQCGMECAPASSRGIKRREPDRLDTE